MQQKMLKLFLFCIYIPSITKSHSTNAGANSMSPLVDRQKQEELFLFQYFITQGQRTKRFNHQNMKSVASLVICLKTQKTPKSTKLLIT